MESYDGAWLLFDAIKTAGNTDAEGASSRRSRTPSMSACAARTTFSTSKDPAWHYHQFLDAPLTILQYTEVKQATGRRADRVAAQVRDGALRLPEAARLTTSVRARPMAEYLLIQAVNGLVIGIIYAVIAAGLTVIFSILKIVNFAHGEVYMMGGYFGYFAIALLGIALGGGAGGDAAVVHAVSGGGAHAADTTLQSRPPSARAITASSPPSASRSSCAISP